MSYLFFSSLRREKRSGRREQRRRKKGRNLTSWRIWRRFCFFRRARRRVPLTWSTRPSNACSRTCPAQDLSLLPLKDWRHQHPSRSWPISRAVTGWQNCPSLCVSSRERQCRGSGSSGMPCLRLSASMRGCWVVWRAPQQTCRGWMPNISRTWPWTFCCGLVPSKWMTPRKGWSFFFLNCNMLEWLFFWF